MSNVREVVQYWMLWILVLLASSWFSWPDLLAAGEEEVPSTPGVNERLNRALGPEGGVQVYMDPEGNVGTVIDQPGGDRKVTVQPPQSQSRNVGPPLQLHSAPPEVPAPVAPPPPPEFPQSAR